MTDLDDLRSFIEVVESGGFNRAARRLGVSKSIVSRRIARMEADLGTRLITRTTRGICATEAGLEFKQRSERIISEFDEAREAVAMHAGEVVGRLRLSAPLNFGQRYLVPVLTELAGRHPRLELEVSFSDRGVDLIGERYDVAVRLFELRDSSLIARRIASVRPFIVASPDYLARYGRPEKPEDLHTHECLIYSGRSALDWKFRAGKRMISVRPKGRLFTDNGEAILNWTIAGLGIAELPSFMVSDAVKSGALVPLLLDYPMDAGAIYVVRPPGPYVPAKVRVLIDIMVERFRGEPVWDRSLMKERGREVAA
ncbi:LysR family transcriptional regulator [Rhizobium sp. 007]|uniref:LysR family transcriptional regulator n=1 Tax=Rhizobium sp. 007 TaxID=2785056 RepID=UPI00189024BB|nr:LysR family transcriptional regulator [Rhizobium sp. 007]QPB23568.1 LysR family transcriptional regulator [Rhizobium sp. 007]